MSYPIYPLREGMTGMPDAIKRLRVNKKGYPTPYFVYRDGDNEPDFRIMDPEAPRMCTQQNRCWICGGAMGKYKTFVAGPLLAVNNMSAEPPSHKDCAIFAARVCPFMLLPKSKRREGALPDDVIKDFTDGAMLDHNPGATVLYTTTSYTLKRNGIDKNSALFEAGEPTDITWYAEGRIATRDVAQAALESSLDAMKESLSPMSDKLVLVFNAAVTLAYTRLPK